MATKIVGKKDCYLTLINSSLYINDKIISYSKQNIYPISIIQNLIEIINTMFLRIAKWPNNSGGVDVSTNWLRLISSDHSLLAVAINNIYKKKKYNEISVSLALWQHIPGKEKKWRTSWICSLQCMIGCPVFSVYLFIFFLFLKSPFLCFRKQIKRVFPGKRNGIMEIDPVQRE